MHEIKYELNKFDFGTIDYNQIWSIAAGLLKTWNIASSTTITVPHSAALIIYTRQKKTTTSEQLKFQYQQILTIVQNEKPTIIKSLEKAMVSTIDVYASLEKALSQQKFAIHKYDDTIRTAEKIVISYVHIENLPETHTTTGFLGRLFGRTNYKKIVVINSEWRSDSKLKKIFSNLREQLTDLIQIIKDCQKCEQAFYKNESVVDGLIESDKTLKDKCWDLATIVRSPQLDHLNQDMINYESTKERCKNFEKAPLNDKGMPITQF